MSVTIYHNPDCGTSRNALAMLRATGLEPIVVEYLKTPSRETLKHLLHLLHMAPRALLREKGTPYTAAANGSGGFLRRLQLRASRPGAGPLTSRTSASRSETAHACGSPRQYCSRRRSRHG